MNRRVQWPGRLLGALAVLLAAPLGAQSERFSGESTVVAVEIPVQVLVDGKPVKGLTRDSFEVLEGRKRRPIVDFEVVDLSMARTREGRPVAMDPSLSPAGRRNFLLLFDLTNSDPSAISRAREAARRLVVDELHPTDLVAVATWSYTRGPRLILGFTTDRSQVKTAVDTLGFVDLRNRAPDPLGLLLSDINSNNEIFGGSTREGGGAAGDRHSSFEQAFVENLEQFAASERASQRQVRGSEVAAFTEGFATLAQLMSNIDGRKYVVLLSQGFDSSLITGTTDPDVQARAARASETGEIWNVDSNERFGLTRSANKLEDMLNTFRRADCAIQAVDIGGLAAAGSAGGFGRGASGRETLLTMAKDTGGQLYENFNDLGEAMGQLLESTSVTYVLTIQPDDLKFDGKFHDLKVRLTGGPSGARLVHRPGYFAPKPFEERAGVERQIDTATLLVSGRPGGDLAGSVAAAAFRGEGDRMHVPVVVELDGALLVAAKGGSSLPLAVYTYAFDEAGGVRDFVSQSLTLDLAQVGSRLAREPLKFVADLRLPPGRYALRTLVRAGEKGAYWLGQNDLVVPAFGSGELVAVTPLAPEPMTSGVVVRSSSSADRTQGLPFPFVLGQQQFYLPEGRPHTAKGKPLRLVLNVYGLVAGDAQVSGKLLAADGQPVGGAAVRVVGHSTADEPGLTRFEVEVDPGRAAAGDYTVELSVEQQGRSSSASTTLRVSA